MGPPKRILMLGFGCALRKCHDWTNLNRTEAGSGNFGRNLGCLIDVTSLDQVVSAQLLFRFGKWSIARLGFAISQSHRFCCLGRLQSVATLNGVGEFLAKSFVFPDF